MLRSLDSLGNCALTCTALNTTAASRPRVNVRAFKAEKLSEQTSYQLYSMSVEQLTNG